MASDREYLNFVLEQLSALEGVTCRPMMGEYVLYYRGTVVGGVYDDRFLLKPTRSVRSLMPDAQTDVPYPGAKPMLVAEIDDRALCCRAVEAIAADLSSRQGDRNDVKQV